MHPGGVSICSGLLWQACVMWHDIDAGRLYHRYWNAVEMAVSNISAPNWCAAYYLRCGMHSTSIALSSLLTGHHWTDV